MYSHTQNENGTFNTRCLYCFMTVASAIASHEELEKCEAHHMCPERAIAELMLPCEMDCPHVRIH